MKPIKVNENTETIITVRIYIEVLHHCIRNMIVNPSSPISMRTSRDYSSVEGSQLERPVQTRVHGGGSPMVHHRGTVGTVPRWNASLASKNAFRRAFMRSTGDYSTGDPPPWTLV
jgi:hypothetical protein